MPAQPPFNDLALFHLMMCAELGPEAVVGSGEQWVFIGPDARDLQIPCGQFERLRISGSEILGNKRNRPISARHPGTIL
jgi:hypothetical protein